MKTAEAFLEEQNLQPDELDNIYYVSYVQMLEFLESYAKEHAIEFMIYAQGLMFSPENCPSINDIYTKWINQH